MKLIGYVNSKGQRDKSSLAAQKARIKAYCFASGHSLMQVFAEADGNQSIEERPQLQAALKLVRSQADGIVALDLRSIAQDAGDVLELVEGTLQPQNKTLVLIDLNVDTSTPTNRMIFTVMAEVAQLEQRVTQESQKQAKAANAQKHNAAINFSNQTFVGELIADGDGQQIIELIHRLYQSEKSNREIAAWLNQQGHRTRGGKRWLSGQVAMILQRMIAIA